MTLLARLLRRKDSLNATLHQGALAPAPGGESSDADALLAEGTRQLHEGDADAARETFKRVLEQIPTCARAFYMLAGVATHDGDMASAVGLIQRAIALEPDRPEFHFSLGSLHAAHGARDHAIASYQAALRLKPDAAEWQLELAKILSEAGRFEAAIPAYRAALRLAAPDPNTWFRLGLALQALRRYPEAEEAFASCTRLAPDSGEAWVNLAMARRDRGVPVEAELAARKAAELAPNLPEAWFVLGSVLLRQARSEESGEPLRRAVTLRPDYEAAWSSLLLSMNYTERWTPREVYETHLEWGRRFPTPQAGSASHDRQPGDRIRIGYLSPDFRQHPVAHFIEPVLRHHDRSRFEVICYHTGTRHDRVTDRLRRHPEHWAALGDITDDELVRRLRADRLDILVELSGHTDGSRLPALVQRVAPIQVTYLGYPNTTGLPAMDYRLTDERADPAGEADALHTERLVRLPEAFLCYAPPAVGDDPHTPPARRDGHLTFGSFNNFAKISGTTVALWARILHGVPGAKLLIKTLGLQDPGLRRLLQQRFEAAGIAADRLIMAPATPSHREHMETYRRIDVALDTFPYHGTTTTLDALWMGVPVVTLAGDRHVSRVGVSIMGALGLSELVAHSADEYVACAVRLAQTEDTLAQFGRSLRARLEASPLTDGAGFTGRLEQAYLRMTLPQP